MSLTFTARRLSQACSHDDGAVICVGDSLTGYNNFREPWPLPTYPDFLQQMLHDENKPQVVVNGGQAGAHSDIAKGLTEEYLELFPSSTHFIFGFGTNDMARIEEAGAEVVSSTIVCNLDEAIHLAKGAGKKAVVFNVPHLNARLFGKGTVARSRRIRDYHNGKLAAFCSDAHVPLADVCSKLAGEHFADGLHPNEVGAKVIAREVFAVLAGTL